ncbi:tetraacyldisaccharide 4'-kinase [Phyllobacterium endophyticum]|uniref:Tetraacyldisaccharide 4'-kinase n=1 Tax=Phyllobacterium endophyticum TaxID=1149773 RepID=A0A2P7B194_9HYPH|nr:tetraacyldisaccharide 4'-kinase [Phyllobacterium endophyticum]MBB3237781.1 tetraacyldisaccharide 4'-kinase [Phyllobacterium endophyticum]PSH60230.1 tetraacyldisaccharide 4'-kinase [Phyllobacterium endophyticum]TYR42400.1 tetraacyldisaccharide 4'-kinase [Phyllobacterium endophyticum]
MTSEAPPFWWERPDWRARVLSPVSKIYGEIAGRRIRRAKPPSIELPVLCIGNFTLGGAGKTPTSISFAKAAVAAGLKPGIVSRGYGGAFSGLHRVDPDKDSARHVGDEPLLLARHAPVVVCTDRLAGARALQGAGCDFIIMDDGFQSARLHFDFALMVVDAGRGIGNGHVFPGGPLRAPLTDQLVRTDALLKIGTANGADKLVRNAARAAKPVYEAILKPRTPEAISDKPLLAFAGIGDPSKFFRTLEETGANVVQTRSFPDHHPYKDEEVSDLLKDADRDGLTLITTAKDQVRLLDGSPAVRAFTSQVLVLEVDLVFGHPNTASRIIKETRDRARTRALKRL